tara:strand:+ start:1575 stop:1844 length:270 start_codon:yes stop_codon:yes gene_type:complete
MDRYKANIKKEVMFRLKSSNDFNLLNDIMIDLVNEGKVHNYYIAKNIHPNNISAKHLIVTSKENKSYTITFDNIASDYRDSVISFILNY